ncbi:hypothetical protein F5880DRAFT_1505847 [Lentinula raphanica]|nr:hypothetical protein F5880DRAFT_1505847 [Lentinula raphanica]
MPIVPNQEHIKYHRYVPGILLHSSTPEGIIHYISEQKSSFRVPNPPSPVFKTPTPFHNHIRWSNNSPNQEEFVARIISLVEVILYYYLFSSLSDTIALFAAAVTIMVLIRSPARHLSATTLWLSIFLCAIAVPVPHPVGGNSTAPTVPGTNATTVPGANVNPLSGSNAPPAPGICKQVADFNLPFNDGGHKGLFWRRADPSTRYTISSKEPSQAETKANQRPPIRSDQFQLWFQNEKLPGFRLFLSAGNPCLVPDLPAKPAKRIFDLMFKKPSQSTQIDGVNELQGISVEFSDIDQRKAFLQQAFGVDKGDPKKPEAARGITYLDNVVNGPVVQYLHSRHKWGKNWVKKTLLSSWKEQMAKMLETVNKWGKERKQPQQPGAQQSQVLESTGSGSRQGSKSLGVNSTTPA